MVVYYSSLALVLVTGYVLKRVYIRGTRLTTWQDKPLVDRLNYRRVLNQVKWVRQP